MSSCGRDAGQTGTAMLPPRRHWFEPESGPRRLVAVAAELAELPADQLIDHHVKRDASVAVWPRLTMGHLYRRVVDDVEAHANIAPARVVAMPRMVLGQDLFTALEDRRHLVTGNAARVHPGSAGKGERQDHAGGCGLTDDA